MARFGFQGVRQREHIGQLAVAHGAVCKQLGVACGRTDGGLLGREAEMRGALVPTAAKKRRITVNNWRIGYCGDVRPSHDILQRHRGLHCNVRPEHPPASC